MLYQSWLNPSCPSFVTAPLTNAMQYLSFLPIWPVTIKMYSRMLFNLTNRWKQIRFFIDGGFLFSNKPFNIKFNGKTYTKQLTKTSYTEKLCEEITFFPSCFLFIQDLWLILDLRSDFQNLLISSRTDWKCILSSCLEISCLYLL